MIPLMLLFVAPIVQIVLSTLRINGRIYLPISVITLLMFILGIVLSFCSMSIVSASIVVEHNRPRCGLPEAAFLICALFITFFSGSIIGIISGICFHFKTKNKREFANSKFATQWSK